MKVSNVVKGVALAVAATLALAGCTAGGNSTNTTGAQTLKIAVNAPPTSFAIGEWGDGDGTLFQSVYDTVLTLEDDGTVDGGIADKWEYNDDRTVLTLHVRDGQKFSDGEVLNADAVVASLDVAREAANTSHYFSSVTSVEAPDESTVVVTLAQPDASVIPAFTTYAGAVGAPKVLTADSSKLSPVGSGAYVLDAAKSQTGSKYVLEKNDDNWNADAYPFKTVEVQIIADQSAMLNAVQSGQLDYSPLYSQDSAGQFSSAKFTVGQNLPTSIAGLWLIDREGKVVPALKDVRVRQAINLAFDRDAIAKSINAGSQYPTEQIVNPNGSAWSDDLNGVYSYNVDKAKSLMAEAGYADGFSVTMPSTFLTTQFEPIVTQSLADIGITVTWETVPFQDFLSKVFAGNYGMFFTYSGFQPTDALHLKLSTSGLYDAFKIPMPTELQNLFAEANKSDTPESFQAINKYIVDQAWAAPLVYTTGSFVHPNDIAYTPPTMLGQSVRPWAPAK